LHYPSAKEKGANRNTRRLGKALLRGDGDEKVKKPMEGKYHFDCTPATSQKEKYGKLYKL
jgi:hypothetical protein